MPLPVLANTFLKLFADSLARRIAYFGDTINSNSRTLKDTACASVVRTSARLSASGNPARS
eukprot:5901880-Pyramimonas_sp.AAC.1